MLLCTTYSVHSKSAWNDFCHSMSGRNHSQQILNGTEYAVHRCIRQALSYLNNYIPFRNIYNTNRLYNKKNEFLYKINCLHSCNNVYFHLLACSVAKREHSSNAHRYSGLPSWP